MNTAQIKDYFKKYGYVRINKHQKEKFFLDISNELSGLYTIQKSISKESTNIESTSPDYKVLLMAHYDTHISSSNYLSSYFNRYLQNKGRCTYVFSVVLCSFLLFALPLLISIALNLSSTEYTFLFIVLLISFYFFIRGIPSIILFHLNNYDNVYDDNTSGIITLIHIAKKIYEHGHGDKIKLLLADNEERNLKGSKEFILHNSNNLKDKLVINLDCVGRGDHIFITSKYVSPLAEELKTFLSTNSTSVNISNKSFSDDRSFWKGNYNSIGICRANKGPRGEKMMPWTHTKHDILDKIKFENIEHLINSLSDFIIQYINDSTLQDR